MRLFALVGFTEDKPITVVTPRMVRPFPTRGNNRGFSNFDNAITGAKTNLSGAFNKIKVCPLKAVSMHVIGNFAQKDTFRFESAIRFSGKWGVQM